MAWLSVLAGPNAGASILLGDGKWTLGRGLSCDIVVADPSVPVEALTLEINGNSISCFAHQDGDETANHNIAVGTPFDIGTTRLIITLGKPAISASAAIIAEEEPPAEPALEPEITEAAAELTESAGWRQFLTRRKISAAAAVAASFVFLVIMSSGLTRSEPLINSDPAQMDLILKHALLQAQIEGDLQAQSVNGDYSVTGLVENDKDRQALQNALIGQLPKSTSFHIRTVEKIRSDCATIIEHMHSKTSVVIADKAIHLSGFVADDREAQTLINIIRSDAASGLPIIDELMTERRATDALHAAIDHAAPTDPWTARIADSRIKLRIALSDLANRSKWEASAEEIGRSVRPLTVETEFVAPPAPIAVVGLNLQDHPYVVLADGRELRRGSQLTDGEHVVAIKRDAMVIDNAGLIQTVPFSGEPNWTTWDKDADHGH